MHFKYVALLTLCVLFFAGEAVAQRRCFPVFNRLNRCDPCCCQTIVLSCCPTSNPCNPCNTSAPMSKPSNSSSSNKFKKLYDSAADLVGNQPVLRSQLSHPSKLQRKTPVLNLRSSGSTTTTFQQSGTYNQQRYTNNEVVIRAIEGFIKEAIIDNFSDMNFKFEIQSIPSNSQESGFKAIAKAGDVWTVKIFDVNEGSFSIEIINPNGFLKDDVEDFQEAIDDLKNSLGVSIKKHSKRPLVRTWTNTKGAQVVAEIISLQGNKLTAKRQRDQKIFKDIDIAVFCEQDRKLIRQHFSANSIAAK